MNEESARPAESAFDLAAMPLALPTVRQTATNVAAGESVGHRRRIGAATNHWTDSNHPQDAVVNASGMVIRRTDGRRIARTSSSSDASLGTAIRLLGETAHDLRSPLASVAATLELIRDGQMGDVNLTQTDALQAAMGQCDYLAAVINEMLMADRLRDGTPRIQRQSIAMAPVVRAVTDATSATLANHEIELFWDTDDGSMDVFADHSILCRMLINLVMNAQSAIARHANPTARCVLIRVHCNPDRGVAMWSVVDSGCGITPASLQRLRSSNGDSVPAGQGTGMGLRISRQLAGLMFSSLEMTSQVDRGTEVRFETPLANPAAIATAFARYRESLRGPLTRKPDWDRSDDPSDPDAAPAAASASFHWIGVGPHRIDRLAIGRVDLDATATLESADQFDHLFQGTLNPFEMVYRAGRRGWVWALDTDDHGIDQRIQGVDQLIRETLPEIDLRWSTPTIVPVRRRTLQSLLIDRMTTASLAAAPVQTANQDEVRLGTPPLTQSPIAAIRLDEELRRLGQRMKSQAARLRQQSANLRG